MYEKKEKRYGIIAILYYMIYILGSWICGVLYQNNIGSKSIYRISVLLFIFGVIIVLVKDRNFKNLGFVHGRKVDIAIAMTIVLITFLLVFICSGLELQKVFSQTLYYLFYIAAIEEVLFRGMIYNYMF